MTRKLGGGIAWIHWRKKEIGIADFVQNNPILRLDSDGALDAPIYDEEGNFLGTMIKDCRVKLL